MHDSVCDKRLKATIATHDLSAVRGPLKYEAKDPDATTVSITEVTTLFWIVIPPSPFTTSETGVKPETQDNLLIAISAGQVSGVCIGYFSWFLSVELNRPVHRSFCKNWRKKRISNAKKISDLLSLEFISKSMQLAARIPTGLDQESIFGPIEVRQLLIF